MAAKQVGRPVRLALTRPQMFGPVGGRPFTEQRIVLAARQDGTLTAMRHDTIATTSTFEDWMEMCGMPSRIMYAVPNHATTHRIVALNVGTPTFMRAPGEASSRSRSNRRWTFRVATRHGPGRAAARELRGGRSAGRQAVVGNKLRECYEVGARRFGWSRRTGAPRTMRDGDTLIGLGMAAATYPANRSEASARARILPDGTAEVASGTQDIGTGTYGDDAGRGRCAWFLAAERALRARRFQPAACAGIGRLAVGGERGAGRARGRAAGARKLVMLAVAAPDRRCTRRGRRT